MQTGAKASMTPDILVIKHVLRLAKAMPPVALMNGTRARTTFARFITPTCRMPVVLRVVVPSAVGRSLRQRTGPHRRHQPPLNVSPACRIPCSATQHVTRPYALFPCHDLPVENQTVARTHARRSLVGNVDQMPSLPLPPGFVAPRFQPPSCGSAPGKAASTLGTRT